uniref:C2 domain-containing protein n=1 Tax=Globodera pallida TaxID=36090 RepID=A0A183BJ03_GLOPA
MPHSVWHNVCQVSSNGWGGECDYCLNYDAQTCSLVFLPLGPKAREALVRMGFDRKSRAVKFSLLQMSDLPRDASIGLLDPYAKVYALINGQKRVAKQKTRVMRRTLSPLFGAEDWLEFVLPDNVGLDADGVPRSLSFNVVLFNHDGVKRNEPIGQFTVDAASELFNGTFKTHQEQNGLKAAAAAEDKERAEWHKGYFAVGLVLVQLLAIILLGICVFLLSMALRRCWRRVYGHARAPPHNKCNNNSDSNSSSTKLSVQEL